MTAPASSSARRRSRRTVVLVLVLVVALMAAVAVMWSAAAVSDREKSARVDAEGFEISIAGARISAPAGVAPEGTTITAAATTADVSGDVFGAAAAVHEGVEISWEGGAQPQQPVQPEFGIPEDVAVADEDPVVVLAYSHGQEVPEILAA